MDSKTSNAAMRHVVPDLCKITVRFDRLVVTQVDMAQAERAKRRFRDAEISFEEFRYWTRRAEESAYFLITESIIDIKGNPIRQETVR
jgi:hypothetical protein